MVQTWENESHFMNMRRIYENSCTWKYQSQWAKWVTFGQMGQTSEIVDVSENYGNC